MKNAHGVVRCFEMGIVRCRSLESLVMPCKNRPCKRMIIQNAQPSEHIHAQSSEPSSGRFCNTSSTMLISSSTSGLSLGSSIKHFRTTSLTASLMLSPSAGAFCLPLCGPSSGNLQSPPSTQMLKLPPVSSLLASKGDLPTKQAYSVHPSDQMSTFVSMTEPVFTSKSSGARYGIVECSAAVS